MGEIVEFPSNGGTASGYLAKPSHGGPGVVVIQEWWGLMPHIKDVCDRLAIDGFTALAPDLYHGETTTEPDAAAKRLMSLDIERAARDMGGAVDRLLQESGRDHVGVVGFCMGGGLALFLTGLRPEVVASVPFYGVGPALGRLDFSTFNADVIGHWGGSDPSVSHQAVDALARRITETGHSAEMFWYEGADHAFFNDTRPEVYNPDAAQLAWDRTRAFFREKLSR